VPNANYALLPKLVPGLKKHGRAVVSGRWDDSVGYLAIATWVRDPLDDGNLIEEGFDAVRDARALIIDVRANSGGDERLAQQLAGRFLSERQLYGKHMYRDPKTATGFTAAQERWVEPNLEQPRYEGKVAVLSGPAVMSSCESFLLMMKTVPGAVIVGAASQGSSGNPQPHDLENGVTVMLPSWKDMTAAGEELAGVGVRPDIEITARPADFKTADPVLEAALTHLRNARPLP
jgi:C-terminal processing protease CtpA/Prc